MAPESRCGREKWVFNLSEKERVFQISCSSFLAKETTLGCFRRAVCCEAFSALLSYS